MEKENVTNKSKDLSDSLDYVAMLGKITGCDHNFVLMKGDPMEINRLFIETCEVDPIFKKIVMGTAHYFLMKSN